MSAELRRKKTAGEKNGRGQYDIFKLYLLKGTDRKIKATNKEILELAEMIRAKRQIKLQYSDHEIITFTRSQSLIENMGIFKATILN